jgi:hypothetical protein
MEQAQQRGLTAAVGPHQRQTLSGVQGQVNVFERPNRAKLD